ncbi:MAG: hypothetical protein HY317_04875 [Acidobacteria bacterium]|nr:hypothetical protein [Acidobacteriota bacterium]
MKPGFGARACALAFLTAAATLFLQVLVHRIVAARLLNNFAFAVISLTMLGFALSGVILTRLLPTFLARIEDAASSCASCFVITALASAVLFYHSDVSQAAHSRSAFVGSVVAALPHALLLAAPFAFCGLVLGALLAGPELSTRRIYFFDLLGSGTGAIAVIPAISSLGAENALLLVCLVLLAGTLLLTPPRGPLARGLACAAVLSLGLCWAMRGRAFAGWYPRGVNRVEAHPGGNVHILEALVWDPVARIEVWRIPPLRHTEVAYPCLVGDDEALLSRAKRMLTQNNYAFTLAVEYDGRRDSLRGIGDTMYAAAYQAHAVARPRVGIIGVGGGFDVLTALHFDASAITGVEVNSATVALLEREYRDYFAAWTGDPRVRLIPAEGRHFLATTDETYDVLQLSGVDSYSGTAAAAHVFSENYLYTAEAFDVYLRRLTDRGILNLMRLEYRPPREMLRALVTAVAALRRAGVEEPAQHVAMLTATPVPNFTALLVKKTPFTAEERRRLAVWAERSPYFDVSASVDPSGAPKGAYQFFLGLHDPQRERAFVAAYPWDISPTDDDRPFFFRYSSWWHVFTADDLVRTSVPYVEISTLILAAGITLACVLCVYLPLRELAGRPGRTPETLRLAGVFAGAGLGYLAVEMAFLQKFGLFLGHPNYALSVVLSVVLVSSGLGSLWSRALVSRLGGLRFVSYVLAAFILLEQLLLLPLLPRLIGLPFSLRAAIVVGLVAPVGVCLGTYVPTALERLKQTAPHYAPWAWGINGIFSVLAPILSVAFSMTWGIGALLVAAVPIYVATGWALPSSDGSAQAHGAWWRVTQA